jgi:dynein heavy chain
LGNLISVGMLSAGDFKSSLMTLDVDNISSNASKSIKAVLKEMDMTYEKMCEISVAGAGLLKFVMAVMGYCNVAKLIQPKRQAVAMLERNLQQSKIEYDRIVKELKRLKEELSDLQVKFHQAKAGMKHHFYDRSSSECRAARAEANRRAYGAPLDRRR